MMIISVFLNAADIKNLYIFIEPTTIQNRINDKNKEINDVLKESERIVADLVKSAKKNHIKNIYISRIWKKFKHNAPLLLKPSDNIRVILKRALKPLYKYHNYNIAKILGDIHSDFEEGISAKESIMVYIGDVNYMNSSLSSTRGYLNSGWLKNKESIFVKKFLKQDNSSLEGLPVFIVNRVQLPLDYEQRKENFIIKLFTLAGLKPIYIDTNPRILSSRVQKNYLEQAFENKLNTPNSIKSTILLDSEICQIVTPNNPEISVPNCGGM